MKKYIVTQESIEKILIHIMQTKDSEGKHIYAGEACSFIKSELTKQKCDLNPIRLGLTHISAWARIILSGNKPTIPNQVMLRWIEEKSEDLIREHLTSIIIEDEDNV